MTEPVRPNELRAFFAYVSDWARLPVPSNWKMHRYGFCLRAYNGKKERAR
jgi:hypothetical protein